MKINFELSTVETRFLKDVVEFIKTLTHKENSLSTITFTKNNEEHTYAAWHNKKSYSVHYTKRTI